MTDELAEARRRKRMREQDFATDLEAMGIDPGAALEEIDEPEQITLSCKRCGSQQFRMILRGNKIIGLCVVSDCEGGVEVEFGI